MIEFVVFITYLYISTYNNNSDYIMDAFFAGLIVKLIYIVTSKEKSMQNKTVALTEH